VGVQLTVDRLARVALVAFLEGHPSFECSSAECGLRVVVGASSKFATSQSQSETNAREVQMLPLTLGPFSGTAVPSHMCAYIVPLTCVLYLVFIMCNHVYMNASYVIYPCLVLMSSSPTHSL
jgi:hypothetical protein